MNVPTALRRLAPFWRFRRAVRHGFVVADRYRSADYARRAYTFYDWHGGRVVHGARTPAEAVDWARRAATRSTE